MEKRVVFAIQLLSVIMFVVEPGFAHMCHDPFRPQDHLVLAPDKELIRIEESGEFRIYIENTFPTALNDVRLFVESQAFDIEIEPQAIERLVPGERSFFLVRLRLHKGFKPGDYPLKINVGAKSSELKSSIEMINVVVEEKRIESKDAGEIVVKVEKIPFWEKTYFYIILILFLVTILVWRKTS